MRLLYDDHCYICSLSALFLAKVSRGFISPSPLEVKGASGSGGFNLNFRFEEASWLVSGRTMRSGLLMLPWALLGIMWGLAHGPGFRGGMRNLYHPGVCTVDLPCMGLSGLVARAMYFVARNAEVPTTVVPEGRRPGGRPSPSGI